MKVAYVVPRYGTEVIGGAELGARLLAEHLVELLGWEVEVLTTCALDARTWADAYPTGESVERGVRVHRFHTEGTRALDFEEFSHRVMASPQSAPAEEERRWIRMQGPVSRGLIEAVAATDADVVAFYPYLYDPTVSGIALAGDRAVLHPAAHDEPPLRLPVFRDVFGAARGLVFHTEGERRLVESLFSVGAARQIVIGLGSEPAEGTADAARSAFGLGDRPYLLCLGRVDDGKGAATLAAFFSAYKERRSGPLALVFAGPVVHAPPVHPDIVVTGTVDDDAKWGLLRGALALVSPSAFESFSLVLIEAWNVQTPVLVNRRCAVTREHVERSGGGLLFGSYAEFEVALDRLRGADLGDALATRGAAYAAARYRWPRIIERYRRFLEAVSADAVRGA